MKSLKEEPAERGHDIHVKIKNAIPPVNARFYIKFLASKNAKKITKNAEFNGDLGI